MKAGQRANLLTYSHVMLSSTDQPQAIIMPVVKRMKPPSVRKGNRRVAFPRTAAHRWARLLAAGLRKVMARHPGADFEDVRLTLIALQSPPLARLNRSLRRGRGFTAFRK
jgi:hypothetical protein